MPRGDPDHFGIGLFEIPMGRRRNSKRKVQPTRTDLAASPEPSQRIPPEPQDLVFYAREARGNVIWDATKWAAVAFGPWLLSLLTSAPAWYIGLAFMAAFAFVFLDRRFQTRSQPWKSVVAGGLTLAVVTGTYGLRILLPTNPPLVVVKEIGLLSEVLEGHQVDVHVSFANTGLDTATEVRAIVEVASTDELKFRPDFNEMDIRLAQQVPYDLGPGVVKSFRTPVPVKAKGVVYKGPMTFEHAVQIRNGSRRIVASGIFRYEDASRQKRETRFCAIYNPAKHPFFDDCPTDNRIR